MVKAALSEELSEEFCFVCKDGGELRACDFRSCLKAYHPNCVRKDDSFLESDEHWTCGWHACFICHKSSAYQCYCCPRSTCAACFGDAQFVSVKSKGFCNQCLRLAILIEENKDVDSEGEKVDFSEGDESLFKDYWDLVKDREGISLIDLHLANAHLKSGEKCKVEPSGPPKDDELAEVDGSEDDNDTEFVILDDFKEGKPKRKKRTTNICKSNRRVFNGWGSDELLEFLESLGKDTKEPRTQLDACDIIKEYIDEKNLHQHDGNKKKKKYVVCDEKLYSIFKKKKLKLHKIYPMLHRHIAANNISDGDFSFNSGEDDDTCRPRKQQKTNFDSKSFKPPNTTRGKPYDTGSLYASIVEKNIKSVYLKRSLVVDLLKDSISFEDKVIGCFVRVKKDQNHFFSSTPYWLGKVLGVKKVQQPYKVGEMSTDTVLSVHSYMTKDIQISLLSDEDFAEVECDDLRQLVKKNLFKRPTVAELELKIRNVHADIVNHWIAKEIARLDKLIDRANEKGWRREFHEHSDKRELLRTSGERQRLLKEVPEVVADICEDEDVVVSAQKGERQRLVKEIPEVVADICENENVAASIDKDSGAKFHGSPVQNGKKDVARSIEFHEDEDVAEEVITENLATLNGHALEEIIQEEVATSDANAAKERFKENEVKFDEAAEERIEGNDAESNMNSAVRSGENEIELLDNAAEGAEEIVSAPQTIEVIEIEDDDEEEESTSPLTVPKMQAADQIEFKDKLWHYLDPEGNEHGPFSMLCLVYWQNKGFFDENFKVWRTGRSPKDAMLLKHAYNLCH